MQTINRPWFNTHQILTGQYARLNQYVDSDGNDYIGPCHFLPNGQVFTEFIPTDRSFQIFEKQHDFKDLSRIYNKINGITVNRYVLPIPHTPIVNDDDYNDGFLYRYFVQKRNSPWKTIQEIDVDQYNSINTNNKPGLNGQLWRGTLVKWKINGSYIESFNSREITRCEMDGFISLSRFLRNLREFVK